MQCPRYPRRLRNVEDVVGVSVYGHRFFSFNHFTVSTPAWTLMPNRASRTKLSHLATLSKCSCVSSAFFRRNVSTRSRFDLTLAGFASPLLAEAAEAEGGREEVGRAGADADDDDEDDDGHASGVQTSFHARAAIS